MKDLIELKCSIDNKTLGEVSKEFQGEVYRICPDCKTKQRFSYQTYVDGETSILGIPMQITRIITVTTVKRENFINKMVTK